MSPDRNITPPRWPVRLLRIFLKKEFLEEIEGDMEEVFHENVELYSLKKARRMYALEMLSLLRPVLLKNLSSIYYFNQHAMFKNYFKISFRSLLKNPVNSFINIFGLSAAIGFCVFTYAFSQWTFNTDQFHEHKNETFLVTYKANKNGTLQEYGKTPAPLADLLRQDFAQTAKVCAIKDRAVVMKNQDNVYHERVRLTDPEFLQMLTFPLKWGTIESLSDINSIILSEDIAKKYFGDENPIGRSITMIYDQNKNKEFKITGVAQAFPRSRTIGFNFLINFQNQKVFDSTFNPHDWKTLVDATLILVTNPASLNSIQAAMEKYRVQQNQNVEEQLMISSFEVAPLATLHKASEHIVDDISRSSRTNYISIMFMVAISVLLLILACVNYINIAIATASKRLKELGVRKSIGASRPTLVIQFLSENVVITSFALIFGLILGYTFFIPGFEFLWSFDMDFKLADTSLWLFLLGVLFITSILSGLYPSLYISRFQVVGILKGTVKFGQKNPLTKAFLALQLILSCIFITFSVLFTQNNIYLSNRPWGYNNRQALYTKVPDQSAYEKFSALMLQQPEILSISGSQHHVGKSHLTTVIEVPDRKVEVDQLAVDANYFETLELKLKEGRTFLGNEGGDRNALIVNEAMVANMGWQSAIGQEVWIDTIEYEVVGVVSDFHNYSFDEKIKPTIFSNASKENYRFLSVKAKQGSLLKAQQAMQASWAKLFPEIPYEGAYQEDVWGRYYEQLDIYSIVWKVIAGIAVSLATLGLYGLVRLNIEGRTKEFSIRKVLGAGLKNIARTITGQYTILFATTIAIGAPLGYILGKWIIESSFPYHTPVNFSAVAIAVILILAVLMGTILTQVFKVQKANPVDGLKVE